MLLLLLVVVIVYTHPSCVHAFMHHTPSNQCCIVHDVFRWRHHRADYGPVHHLLARRRNEMARCTPSCLGFTFICLFMIVYCLLIALHGCRADHIPLHVVLQSPRLQVLQSAAKTGLVLLVCVVIDSYSLIRTLPANRVR